MAGQPRTLDRLLEDLAFEAHTRSERFARVGETEPDDPGHAALLSEEETLTDDPILAMIQRITRTMAFSAVMHQRTMIEVGRSLAFDLTTLETLASKVAEQADQIAELRSEVAALRESRDDASQRRR